VELFAGKRVMGRVAVSDVTFSELIDRAQKLDTQSRTASKKLRATAEQSEFKEKP
jgi:hypothetical protein